jgi:hypothetical protein
VNGGGPLATPLRALRHAPVLVDDVAIVPRLHAAARSIDASASGALDVEELIRWTRAWLIVWQSVLHARGIIGSIPPWTAPVPIADVPSLKGDPDRRRRTAATALLEKAMLLHFSADRAAATLDESAFLPHRAGLELNWEAVCHAVRYEPAPVLIVRALAEVIVPPREPSPVTLRELADRTGYAQKQVRVGLRRLIEAHVLGVSESAGAAARYWFVDASAGSERPAAPALSQPARLDPPLTPDPRHAPAPVPAGRHVAVRMTLNGVTVSLGPGLQPHVELGPDGIPHVTFDGPPDEISS